MDKQIFPSERAIFDAVKSLDPSKAQQLAELFFQIRDGLFINPIGRNPDGQAIKGYPDIVGRKPGSKRYLVEATKGDWRGHLGEDTPKLSQLKKGAYEGFRFLCFRKTESELAQTNRKVVRETVVEAECRVAGILGLDPVAVEFVFLNEFAREIRSAKYHRVLVELGLNLVPAPFYTDLRFVQGYADFVPSAAEYEAELVVPNAEVQRAFERVSRSSITLIEGDGGSGKTSLALAVATEYRKRGGVFLYLDAQTFNWDGRNERLELANIPALFADAEILIVLDNVHLAGAAGILEFITSAQSSGVQFRFLLTARISKHSDQWKRLGHYEYLRRVPSGEDVNAAYHRLLSRHFPGQRFRDIPEAIAESWSKKLPDLIALSLALDRFARTGPYDQSWKELRIEDALSYVRERFISRLPTEDLASVEKIASLAILEMPTSLKSLGDHIPQAAISLGFVRERPDSKTARYELAHHELGKLITSLEGPDIEKRLAGLMASDPFQATFIAQKLNGAGKGDLAKKLLPGILARALSLSEEFSLGHTGAVLGTFVQAGVTTYPEIANSLLPEIDRFFDTKSDIVTGLSSFLGVAAEEMAEVYSAALGKLSEPTMMKKMEGNLPFIEPTTFSTLYRYAHENAMPFLPVLRKYLNKPARIEAFARKCKFESPEQIDICCKLIEQHFSHYRGIFDDTLNVSLHHGYLERLGAFDLLELKYTRAVKLVVTQANREDFERFLVYRDCDDATLIELSKAVASLGRNDLAEIAAGRVASRVFSSIWYDRRTGGKALRNVLIRAPITAKPDLRKILERQVADRKIRPILRWLRPHALAKLIFTLWDQHADLLPLIPVSELEQLLSRRFKARAAEFSDERITSVYAAGVAFLADLAMPPSDWVNVPIHTDDFEGNRTNPVFWIGLRELEHLGMVSINPHDRLQMSLNKTVTHSQKAGRLIVSLNDWASGKRSAQSI